MQLLVYDVLTALQRGRVERSCEVITSARGNNNCHTFRVQLHPTHSVSLPHVGGGPHPQVAVDDQGVVDVDEEGQLLLAAQRQQLHPLQLDGQLAVALEVGVLRHAFVVYRLAGQQKKKKNMNTHKQSNQADCLDFGSSVWLFGSPGRSYLAVSRQVLREQLQDHFP